MAMLLDALTLAVLALVGFRLVDAHRHAWRSHLHGHTLELVRGLRARHLLMAVPVLSLVALAAAALVQVPGLDFGWWTAIGGTGNPVLGATSRTAGSPLAVLVPAVFLALVVPLLPLFAEREEQMFRAGSEYRSLRSRIWWGLKFGLVHTIVGIPVGVALALSIGGWYFTRAYLRGWRRGGRATALAESTRAHLAYNLVIFVLVAVLLATGGPV